MSPTKNAALAAYAKKKAASGRFFQASPGNAQAENDEPQPQVVVAFGFLITN
jgi:hypothetical protein